MTRRRLLLILASLAAALGGAWWSRRDGGDGAAAKLAGTIAARDSAARVGEAVLTLLPADTGAEELMLDIARRLGIEPAALEEMADRDLLARLSARISAEHRSGDTLAVQGWQLAATEARLYALAALR